MKIDHDYLKKLLEACQASEKPTFDIQDLKADGFDYNDPKFEFHMAILDDQGFIQQDGGDPGFGLRKSKRILIVVCSSFASNRLGA